MRAQLDQLMSSVAPSGATAASVWPSTQNVNNAPQIPGVSDPLSRIPASNEVPTKDTHSAPPPRRSIRKKLDETAWKTLVSQVEIAEIVSLRNVWEFMI